MAVRRTHRTWHGDEFVVRSRRATGRAIVGMGEQVSVEMTKAAHTVSGDLKRSIHAAKADTMGEVGADDDSAREKRDFWQVEVGSWLPYACVENNRGGDHRFADIGYSEARPRFRPTLIRAWREEGL